jgi:site-specific DNA-methyltransferase (adenine-specific)
MGKYKLINADCLEAMTRAKPESVDAIVTDPPYGLAFMGKQWDHGVPGAPFWEAALRVAKPGAHLLAFGGTRTYHRLACAIEDAGWEIRDCLMWVYGSGFPKSLDVSKAIDKTAGAEREVVGTKLGLPGYHLNAHQGGEAFGEGLSSSTFETRLASSQVTAPATEAAKQWQGWGTALKPAYEPILLARKPFPTTVAANVLTHGTGGLNIDGCRVGTDEVLQGSTVRNDIRGGGFASGHKQNPGDIPDYAQSPLGRWPANFIHDGSDEACSPLGESSRFFYCAKASKKDRDEGLDAFNSKASSSMSGRRNPENAEWDTGNDVTSRFVTNRKNVHPTVKPTDLMRYLCRLITPPGGVILDPFMGSGSTGKAAILEGFRFIGIEKETEYLEITKARIEFANSQGGAK